MGKQPELAGMQMRSVLLTSGLPSDLLPRKYSPPITDTAHVWECSLPYFHHSSL